MNGIFNGIPLPDSAHKLEYDCGKGCHMLVYTDLSASAFDESCKKIAEGGFILHSENKIKDNTQL